MVSGAILDADTACLGWALGVPGMPTNLNGQMLTPKTCGYVKRKRSPYGNASFSQAEGERGGIGDESAVSRRPSYAVLYSVLGVFVGKLLERLRLLS